MRHLQKLGQVPTITAMNAVLRQAALWEQDAAWDCPRIILRGQTDQGNYANWFAFDMFPQLRQVIFGIMSTVEGEHLGQVSLAKFAPGMTREIPNPVEDDLFICALHAFPGASFHIGAESVMIQSGDIWWLDHLPISLVNNSQDDVVLLLVRATPNAPATYVPEVSNADLSK